MRGHGIFTTTGYVAVGQVSDTRGIEYYLLLVHAGPQVDDLAAVLSNQCMKTVKRANSTQAVWPILCQNRNTCSKKLLGASKNMSLVTLSVHPRKVDIVEVYLTGVRQGVDAAPRNLDDGTLTLTAKVRPRGRKSNSVIPPVCLGALKCERDVSVRQRNLMNAHATLNIVEG